MIDPDSSDTENGEVSPRCPEQAHRSVLDTIEAMLAFDDFHKQVDNSMEPQNFIRLLTERINELIRFDVSAIYFVDQETSDVKLISCIPTANRSEPAMPDSGWCCMP